MKVVTAIGILVIGSLLNFPAAAQDADEVARLKQKIELLEAKLKAAEAERDAPQAKVRELEQKAGNDPKNSKETSDLFQEGSRWTGSRFYTHKGADPKKAQEWTLTVTKRDKNSFEGEISFVALDDRRQTLSIEGTAPQADKGQVRFKTNQKGVLQQVFTGTLAGGQIAVTFTGTAVNGMPVSGTGNLKK